MTHEADELAPMDWFTRRPDAIAGQPAAAVADFNDAVEKEILGQKRASDLIGHDLVTPDSGATTADELANWLNAIESEPFEHDAETNIRHDEPPPGFSLLELEPCQCRFPIAEHEGQHRFCGAPTVRLKRTNQYCAEHYWRAYSKPNPVHAGSTKPIHARRR